MFVQKCDEIDIQELENVLLKNKCGDQWIFKKETFANQTLRKEFLAQEATNKKKKK